MAPSSKPHLLLSSLPPRPRFSDLKNLKRDQIPAELLIDEPSLSNLFSKMYPEVRWLPWESGEVRLVPFSVSVNSAQEVWSKPAPHPFQLIEPPLACVFF